MIIATIQTSAATPAMTSSMTSSRQRMRSGTRSFSGITTVLTSAWIGQAARAHALGHGARIEAHALELRDARALPVADARHRAADGHRAQPRHALVGVRHRERAEEDAHAIEQLAHLDEVLVGADARVDGLLAGEFGEAEHLEARVEAVELLADLGQRLLRRGLLRERA